MSSELMDAIGAGIAGRSIPSVDSPLSEILNGLVEAAGTAAGAARMLGVSNTTFYRWRNHAQGKAAGVSQAPKIGRQAMVAATRRAALGPATERRIRSGELKLVIKGEVEISGDARVRKVDVGKYITQRKMGNVLTAWLAGDDDRADRLLMGHIHDGYADIEFNSVNWAEFQSGEES